MSDDSNAASAELREFARRYTAAWCSQNAANVAAFYAANGSLCINGGAPAVGRAAITQSAQEFMTAFPDLQVHFDNLILNKDSASYHWTLTGTHTGAGQNSRPVCISGLEVWKFGADGLIAESQGSFDAAEYQRQFGGRSSSLAR